MATVTIRPGTLAAAAGGIPDGQPVCMVNLLRYRDRADYGGRTDVTPCSGRQAYFERYVAAFNRVPGAEVAKVRWVGDAVAGLVAPDHERWDAIDVVEYPSFAAFRRVVESDVYLADAEPHRLAALADWRLIATVAVPPPG